MPAFITFGRILFAVLFIYLGASKLFAIQATADFITAKVTIPDVIAPYAAQLETASGMKLPQLLAVTGGVFEVIAGLMIAVNFGLRFFAVLLILYMACETFYFYDFWNEAPPENATTLVEALKNLSIIGALFMILGYGKQTRIGEAAFSDV